MRRSATGFGISVNEIFLPLSAGARLVLAEPGRDGDVGHLLDLIRRERVTFAYLVSTILSLMLERPDAGEATASLRHLWCGGEVLTPELYRRFRDRLPDTTMYHGYGPAEATIGVSCQVYSAADASGASGRITIGRPNPNTRIYLLDEYLSPVPPGVPGELYLGGVPLARGYLNDPAQTASRFVADPFGSPGGRLYRTGDLGRYRANGQIEFLGRADNQVKIGGVRIEPGEVEAALSRHPAVSQAAVVAARDRLGTAYLAAYYVATGAAGTAREDTAEAELVDWLRGRLPAHMTPRRCVRLAAFPLMPSGKTDRKALTAMAERGERERADRPAGPGTHVPPRGQTQQEIAAIWAEIFGTVRVGGDDNFFDLGGHSILLVKVQTQLRARLGRDVPVLDLFSHPTVASLADYLDRSPENAGRRALEIILPLRPEGDLPPLFCLHPAAGLSWPFAGLRQHLDVRRPLYGIQARGMARPRRPATSMADLAAEYVDHVRQVQPHGPYHLLGWSFGGVAAHTMACQLREAGESVAFLAMLDSYPSYPWVEFSADYEQKALRSLLYMSHYDVDGVDGQPLRLGRVLEIVRAHGGMLSSLDDQALSAVVNTFVNSAVLQQSVRHQRYDGDLLFFTAAAERRDRPLSHGDWRPYVTGTVDNHDVACEHRDLGQPGALAAIGPVVDARLRALAGDRDPRPR
jgi:thioesterase domain-containing protein